MPLVPAQCRRKAKLKRSTALAEVGSTELAEVLHPTGSSASDALRRVLARNETQYPLPYPVPRRSRGSVTGYRASKKPYGTFA